jgi:hypothetical protein
MHGYMIQHVAYVVVLVSHDHDEFLEVQEGADRVEMPILRHIIWGAGQGRAGISEGSMKEGWKKGRNRGLI